MLGRDASENGREKLRAVVMVSGGGTNLQAIIDGVKNGTITNTELVGVISNNRNAYALNIDERLDPPMFQISETHYAATWLLDERAPKVEMPPELKARIERMKKEGI